MATSKDGAVRQTPIAIHVLLVVIAVISIASLVVGIGVALGSLSWLEDLSANPREPPGQMVSIFPMAGVLIGAVMAIVGTLGTWLTVRFWSRGSRARTRGRI